METLAEKVRRRKSNRGNRNRAERKFNGRSNERQLREKSKPKPQSLTPAEAAVEYAGGVLDGSVIASRRFRQQVQRWLAACEGGADFRPHEVDRFYAWCAERLVYPNGHKRGQPFLLAPYQLLVVAFALATFESSDENADRLYSEIFWCAGKGSSKTCLLAAILLAHMDSDMYAQGGTMLPVISKDAEQAKATLFGFAGMLVDMSPWFADWKLTRSGSSFTGLSNPANNCSSLPFSRDSRTNKRGIITSFVAVDEYSDMVDATVVEQAEGGFKGGAGQTWYTTNGGGFREYPAHSHYQTSCKVLDGQEDAPFLCPIINEFDDPEKWQDEIEWYRANPMLDVGVPRSYYANKVAQVASQPWRLPEFLRLYGSQWVQSMEGWLDLDLWIDEIEDDTLTLADFKGKLLCTGIDLAKTDDLIAYVCMADDGTTEEGLPKFIAFMRAFVCHGSKGIAHRAHHDRIPYEDLARGGHLIVSPGKNLDYRQVATQLQEDSHECDLVLGYDSKYKSEFDVAAEGIIPSDVKQWSHPQSAIANINKPEFLNMDRSIRLTEDIAVSGRLRFVPNPVMRIALSNARIEVKSGGHRQFETKNTGGGKFDPAVALAMSTGTALLPAIREALAKPKGHNPLEGLNAIQLYRFLNGEEARPEDANPVLE